MEKPKFISKSERQSQSSSQPSPNIYNNQSTQPTQTPINPQKSSLNTLEKQSIRERYMGIIPSKKPKNHKISDRKFNFEWEDTEDTTADSTIVQSMHLIGRSHIAGFDSSVQQRQQQLQYKQLLKSRSDPINPPIFKHKEKNQDDRHWRDKPLAQMKERDWRIFREDFDITTRGGDIPVPLRNWKESNIPDKILRVIESAGYRDPTPIQRQAIPIGMLNRDIIGIAETGSGKTCAFVVPMLSFILNLPPLTFDNAHLGPYAIIMAPTRELVQQIEQETVKLSKHLGFTCVSLVGGHAIGEQAFNLRDGAHIVIATPGRLRDMLDRRILVFAQCNYVVMDEADRMIDLGFEEDMNFILDALPSSNLKPETQDPSNPIQEGVIYRQTVMFSATMPPAVERLAKKFLRQPAVVNIGQAGKVVDRIQQRVEMVGDDNQKKSKLEGILSSGEFEPPMLIFVNQKRTCDILSRAIENLGYRATTLHGGKSQDQREASLALLKTGKKDILVATDVAGRGIDIKNVSLVLNYDMAKNIEDYTHRIGRTGRAGSKGTAITFLTPSDSEVYYDLKQLLMKSPNSTVPAELARHEAAQTKGGREMKKLID